MADLSNEELRAEVAKAGLRLATNADDELEKLKKRLDIFMNQAVQAFDAALDTRKAQTALGDQLIPLLNDIRSELGAHRTRISDLERAKAALEKSDAAIASALTEHEKDITGLHKRLIVVEETLTKKPAKRRKKSKRKGPRK